MHVNWATASTGPRRQVGHVVNWAAPSGGPRRQVGHAVRWATASTGPRRQVGHGDNWATTMQRADLRAHPPTIEKSGMGKRMDRRNTDPSGFSHALSIEQPLVFHFEQRAPGMETRRDELVHESILC